MKTNANNVSEIIAPPALPLASFATGDVPYKIPRLLDV